MPFVTLSDGVRLYYETEGSGEPLLLVMGQANDHHGWDLVRPGFADRWQVIVYDQHRQPQPVPRLAALLQPGFDADAHE